MSDDKQNESTNFAEKLDQMLSQLMKRVWSDDQLKQRMLNDPESLLRENGVEIPAGTKPRVILDKDSVSFEFLPQKAAEEVELTEGALSAVVGGLNRPTGKSPIVYLKYTMTDITVTS